MCEHLEALAQGEIKRLIVNVPPRTMKSLTCNVFFPAWVWAQKSSNQHIHYGPRTRFIFSSHSWDLTLRDSTKCRAVIDSDKYRAWYGDRYTLAKDQNAKHRYRNSETGERLATSVEGKLTGEGANIIGIDDPHDPVATESDLQRENVINWWRYKMASRLNDASRDAFFLVMQRLHQRDLCGFLLAQGGWEHLCLPMLYEPDHPAVSVHDLRKNDGDLLWKDRFPKNIVEEARRTLGAYGFAGQMQQRPAPREGSMFDPTKWKYCEPDQVPQEGQVVRGWDIGATEDARAAYSCGLKMRNVKGHIYIEHVTRFRAEDENVTRRIVAIAEQDGRPVQVFIPQDPGAAGKLFKQHLVRALIGFKVRSSPESGDKAERAIPLSDFQKEGNVTLVRGTWNDAFVDEAAIFPNSEYKDQVDAATRAFAWFSRRKKGTSGIAAPVIIS